MPTITPCKNHANYILVQDQLGIGFALAIIMPYYLAQDLHDQPKVPTFCGSSDCSIKHFKAQVYMFIWVKLGLI